MSKNEEIFKNESSSNAPNTSNIEKIMAIMLKMLQTKDDELQNLKQQKLDDSLELLKNAREQNTILQKKLENLTKTHEELKSSYEDLVASKRNNSEFDENEIEENQINFEIQN